MATSPRPRPIAGDGVTLPGRDADEEGGPTLTFRAPSDPLDDDAATEVFGALPEAEQTVLRCGTYVGDYQLLYPIADGGMGAVWCARPRRRDANAPRSVVIKTILPQLAGETHLRALFLDELRLASRIHHPNVVEVRETGESAGVLFAVMDDVDGGSLSAFQKWVAASPARGRVPPMLAASLVAQAARGLHVAHELRGDDGALLEVVHRDISPQNVLVDATGRALVIDFGLAKSFARIADATRSRSMRGKVRYMAPEQAAGKPVDRRADVWALGATLHQLVVGTTPYDGPNDMVVMHALVTGQPLLPFPRYVPRELGALLERCLAHDPAARHETAEALADALDRIVSQSDTPRPRADHADLVDGFVRSGRVRREESFDRALRALQGRKTIPDFAEVSGVSPVVADDDGHDPTLPARPDLARAGSTAVPAADPPRPRSSRELTTTKPSRRRASTPPPKRESFAKTAVAFVFFVLAVIAAWRLSQGPQPAYDAATGQAPSAPAGAATVPSASVVAGDPPRSAEPPPSSPVATAPSAAEEPKVVAPTKALSHHPAATKAPKPKPTTAEPPPAPAKPTSTLDSLLDKRH